MVDELYSYRLTEMIQFLWWPIWIFWLVKGFYDWDEERRKTAKANNTEPEGISVAVSHMVVHAILAAFLAGVTSYFTVHLLSTIYLFLKALFS